MKGRGKEFIPWRDSSGPATECYQVRLTLILRRLRLGFSCATRGGVLRCLPGVERLAGGTSNFAEASTDRPALPGRSLILPMECLAELPVSLCSRFHFPFPSFCRVFYSTSGGEKQDIANKRVRSEPRGKFISGILHIGLDENAHECDAKSPHPGPLPTWVGRGRRRALGVFDPQLKSHPNKHSQKKTGTGSAVPVPPF